MASFKDIKKLAEKCMVIKSFGAVSSYLVGQSTCFLDWILICLCFSSARYKLLSVLDIENEFVSENENRAALDWDIEVLTPKSSKLHLDEDVSANEIQEESIDEKFLEKIRFVSDFKYPFEDLEKLPVKVAASKLSHSGEWQQYFASSSAASFSILTSSFFDEKRSTSESSSGV